MTNMRKLLSLNKVTKRILTALPVVVAVATVVILVKTRTGPVKKAADEISRSLRVIEAPKVSLVPKALGYGLAEPKRVWQAVSEVKGTVISVHPQLEAGALVDEGTVLLKVNPADYELAVARLKANISETRARINELAVEEQNKKTSLEIEKRSLMLARKSLERMRDLLKKDAIPQDQADREERNVLQQEQVIQKLENDLAQIPARRDTLEAGLDMHKSNLAQAELDLNRTVIRAPFNCRIGDVSIEAGQVLNIAQRLFEAHGTDSVEIEAKFRPEQMRNLLPAKKRQQFQPGITMKALQQLFDLTVIIRLRSGDWEATWPARFDRIREAVDPRTRAINVVAAVDEPYAKVVPGVRPALVRGMYCEMVLQAPPRPDTVVLPRSAVWNGCVYLVDANGRLRKKAVQVAFSQDDLVILESGLSGGELVIVSDPAPAIEGMKVEAVLDAELHRQLLEQAEGGEALR